MDGRREVRVDGKRIDIDSVKELINAFVESDRMRTSSHFSDTVYTSEPILTTGRQMASYLPERYRQMREISRWQEVTGPSGLARGRWLTEAELFWRQGTFMADWEDDCPYLGSFKSYYPTYNAMSDRQLRGYFTWRAAVRAGDLQHTCTSFAFVYMYELLCGIGVDTPEQGFRELRAFWEAYRAFAPELDRYAQTWLMDYAAWHGIDPALVEDLPALDQDRTLAELSGALEDALAALPDWRPRALVPWLTDDRGAQGEMVSPPNIGSPEPLASRDTLQQGFSASAAPRRKAKGRLALRPGVPPLGDDVEERLFRALDALSTYRPAHGRFYREAPADVRHVTCAVFLRLADHYDAHRKQGLLESFFGAQMELPHTMFASAVFHAPERHSDTVYRLGPWRAYRCQGGMWTCTRVHGEEGRSAKLGELMRAVDRTMRDAWGFTHPLKDNGKTPKYLQKILGEEAAARLAWAEAHKPVDLGIDLGALAGIRRAAETTREALLIDEERDGTSSMLESKEVLAVEGGKALLDDATIHTTADDEMLTGTPSFPGAFAPSAQGDEKGIVLDEDEAIPNDIPAEYAATSITIPSEGGPSAGVEGSPGAQAPIPGPGSSSAGPLSPTQATYLHALLNHDTAASQQAVTQAGISEDMLVDAINEALFDLIGDTALEFGAAGPQIIEDYIPDVEGILDHV